MFASPASAAAFLGLNGAMLFGAERLRRRAPERNTLAGEDERIALRVGWGQAAGVGAAQAIALLPGFSRSGATMSGRLLDDLSNEDAARLAFTLATPIVGAAATLKLPELLGPQGDGVRGPARLGAPAAAPSTPARLDVRAPPGHRSRPRIAAAALTGGLR